MHTDYRDTEIQPRPNIAASDTYINIIKNHQAQQIQIISKGTVSVQSTGIHSLVHTKLPPPYGVRSVCLLI